MYYRSLNAYLRETFGCKVYKLALSAGCTCPNRDGTIGTRGCIFCSGSGEFAASASLSIPEQLAQAKRLVAAKAGPDARYIAYFQDFTNTYAPAEVLRPLFAAAIRQPEVCALSIATRPDCLPPEILSLLAELRAEKPVWVELGLQTIHASTAAYIRRSYPLSVYDEAVRALHVLTGTDLAADYAAGKFETLTLDAYITLLEACLRVLPREMVIHRLTGDGAKRDLLAPRWSGDKKRVINEIRRRFLADDLEQGSDLPDSLI